MVVHTEHVQAAVQQLLTEHFDRAAPKYPALEGGSAVRPRSMSDALSPIIIVGALRFPLAIDGMMELSTTRRPSVSAVPKMHVDPLDYAGNGTRPLPIC